MGHIVSPVWVSGHYRFRNDDGTINTATYKAAEDTSITQDTGAIFRLNMNFGESAGQTEATTIQPKLQFSINSGTWTDISGSSAVQLGSGSTLGGGSTTTEHLATPPTGCAAWAAGTACRYSDTNATYNISVAPADEYHEFELALLIDAAQVSDADTIEFRLLDGTETFTTTDTTPTLTVNLVDPNITVTVPLSTFALADFAPVIATDQFITVPLATKTLASFAPVIAADIVVKIENTFTATGTNFTDASDNQEKIARAGADRVFTIHPSSNHLKVIDRVAGVWSQTGNSATVAAGSNCDVVAVSSTRAVIYNDDNLVLEVWDFDGTDFTQTGNDSPVQTGATGSGALCVVDPAIPAIGFLNTGLDVIRVFSFDETNFTQEATLSVTLGTYPDMGDVDDNLFMVWVDGSMRRYSWDGSTTIAQVGSNSANISGILDKADSMRGSDYAFWADRQFNGLVQFLWDGDKYVQVSEIFWPWAGTANSVDVWPMSDTQVGVMRETNGDTIEIYDVNEAHTRFNTNVLEPEISVDITITAPLTTFSLASFAPVIVVDKTVTVPLSTFAVTDFTPVVSSDTLIRMTSISLQGTRFSSTSMQSDDALSRMGDARVLHSNDFSGFLEVYDYTEGTGLWALVGNRFTFAGGEDDPLGCALSSSTAAVYDGVTQELKHMSFDETNWSEDGNTIFTGPAISAGDDHGIARMTDTRIAMVGENDDLLYVYDWSGSAWSTVGTGLNLGSANYKIQPVNETDILVRVSSVWRYYRFNGSTWSQIGNAVGDNQLSALWYIKGNLYAGFHSNTDTFHLFTFDDTDFVDLGVYYELNEAAASPNGCAMTDNRFAFIDNNIDLLGMYQIDDGVGKDFVNSPLAPSISVDISVVAPLTTFTLADLAPVIVTDQFINVPLSTFSVANFPPVIEVTTGDVSVDVPLSTFNVADFIPVILTDIAVAVPTTAMTLAGLAPTLVVDQIISVPSEALTLAPLAPSVITDTVINVPSEALTLAPLAPSVITDTVINVPSTALTLTPIAPVISVDLFIDIPSEALTLAPIVPRVITDTVINVPSEALTLTPIVPSIITDTIVNVPSTALTLTPIAPIISVDIFINVPSTALTLTPNVPVIVSDIIIDTLNVVPFTLTPNIPHVIVDTIIRVGQHSFIVTSPQLKVITALNKTSAINYKITDIQQIKYSSNTIDKIELADTSITQIKT